MFRRLLHTPVALLVRRIAVLYGILLLCRIVFLIYNAGLIWPIAGSEVWPLLKGALKFDTASILYANALFILLSLLPAKLASKRWWHYLLLGYYMVVNALLVVVTNMADTVYFRYTQKRFTSDEIFFAQNDNSAQLIGKFMAENWYLVVVGAGLIWLLWVGYGRKVREESLFTKRWEDNLASLFWIVVAAGLTLAGIRGGMTRMTRPITLSNAMYYTTDGGKANLILSNPFCILRTIGGGSVKYKKFFPPEELAAHFTPEHRLTADPKVNLKGRNVVIFIMESMSAEHSAYLRPELYKNKETKGFTPFLDSLMRTGYCFRQMYANGTRSIQAMPSVLGSIPSFKTPFVLMPQSLGQSCQLPAMLDSMGYQTAFFCGSERGSMGFGAYARSAGIERLISREDYEARHGKGDFDGYWGIWDEPFLQFMGEELSTMKQPFMATLFTLSSHHPFKVPEKYTKTLPDGYTKIHKGVAYDDQAFRKFFARYAGEAWFRNTIFLFVADHVSSEKFSQDTHTYPENHHIIGFIYTPDGALTGQIDDVVQQLDLMPTVLGLLDNRRPYFAFGRDVLNEPQRPAWSVSYDGDFRALTSQSALRFDDNSGEIKPRQEEATAEPDSLLDSFRALVQQYYTRIEQKDYTAHD